VRVISRVVIALDSERVCQEPFGLKSLLRYDELLRRPGVEALSFFKAMVSRFRARQEIQK